MPGRDGGESIREVLERQRGAPQDFRLVHRLDRDTSGVLLAAKTKEAFLALRQAFSDGLVDKTYWAIASGAPGTARSG